MSSFFHKMDSFNSSKLYSNCSLSKVTVRPKKTKKRKLSEIEENNFEGDINNFASLSEGSSSNCTENLNVEEQFEKSRHKKLKVTILESSHEYSMSKPFKKKRHRKFKLPILDTSQDFTTSNIGEKELNQETENLKNKKHKKRKHLQDIGENYLENHLTDDAVFKHSVKKTKKKKVGKLFTNNEGQEHSSHETHFADTLSSCKEKHHGNWELDTKKSIKKKHKKNLVLVNKDQFLNVSEKTFSNEQEPTINVGADTISLIKHKNKHFKARKQTEVDPLSEQLSCVTVQSFEAEFPKEKHKKKKEKHRRKLEFGDKELECLIVTDDVSDHAETTPHDDIKLISNFYDTKLAKSKSELSTEPIMKNMFNKDSCKQEKKLIKQDLDCKKDKGLKTEGNENGEKDQVKLDSVLYEKKHKVSKNSKVSHDLEKKASKSKSKTNQSENVEVIATGNTQTNCQTSYIQEDEEMVSKSQPCETNIKNKHKNKGIITDAVIYQNEAINVSKFEPVNKKSKKKSKEINDIDRLRNDLLEKYLHNAKIEEHLNTDSRSAAIDEVHKPKVKKEKAPNEIDIIRNRLLSSALKATPCSSFSQASEVPEKISITNFEQKTSPNVKSNKDSTTKLKRTKLNSKNEIADIQQALLSAALKSLNSKKSIKNKSILSEGKKNKSTDD